MAAFQHRIILQIFKSTEAWPQSSRKLLKTSSPTLFQTSDKNFSKLLTKTSQNFQSSTFGYENFLPKLLKTSNPPLFVTKTSNSSTFCYENFQILHFWLRNHSNFSKLFTKTSYENFSKLPILHSSNPLAILRKLLAKTSNSLHFWLRKLLSQTSDSSTFGYENLKLPILSQTSDSSNLKT